VLIISPSPPLLLTVLIFVAIFFPLSRKGILLPSLVINGYAP
jgi:hypothetical protein